MPSKAVSYEQCGEVKFGQVGIATLRIQSLDIGALCEEMRERVARAPKLFQNAAVILDFSALPQCPSLETVESLIDGLRARVPPLPRQPSEREVCLTLRELRNSW